MKSAPNDQLLLAVADVISDETKSRTAADRELNLYRTLRASAKHIGAADDEPSEH